MRHFLGWPGAKAVLGLGGLSDRTATLAVWTILQVELAFVAPLYTVSKGACGMSAASCKSLADWVAHALEWRALPVKHFASSGADGGAVQRSGSTTAVHMRLPSVLRCFVMLADVRMGAQRQAALCKTASGAAAASGGGGRRPGLLTAARARAVAAPPVAARCAHAAGGHAGRAAL